MGVLFKVVWMDQLVPNDSLNIYFDSIRKMYLPKMLQNHRKLKNGLPRIAPILPQYMDPLGPLTPQGGIFFSLSKA